MALAIAFVLGAGTTLVIAGPPPPPPPVTGTGTDLTRVKTISSVINMATSSTTFVDLSEASRTIQVSGGSALLVARFTANTNCSSPVTNNGFIRLVVNDGATDTPMNGPSSGIPCPSVFEGHSVEGFLTVGPGTYTVKVQFSVTNSAGSLNIGVRVLTVERFTV